MSQVVSPLFCNLLRNLQTNAQTNTSVETYYKCQACRLQFATTSILLKSPEHGLGINMGQNLNYP